MKAKPGYQKLVQLLNIRSRTKGFLGRLEQMSIHQHNIREQLKSVETALGAPHHTQLVQLHTIMIERLDSSQIERIGRTLLGDVYDRLHGPSKRDLVRELILAAERRGLVPKLITLYEQTHPDPDWQTRDLNWLYANAVQRVGSKRLRKILFNEFSTQDLRQLCFYLGVFHEDILWTGEPDTWGEPDWRWYREQRAIPKSYTTQKVVRAFKKERIGVLVGFCKDENIWEQSLSACQQLHPGAL